MKSFFGQTFPRLAVPAGVLLAGALCAYSQGIITGSISGTVTDNTGAVVMHAPVSAKNNATGLVLSSITDDHGDVQLKDAPIGTYTLVVNGPGFAPLTLTDIVVNANIATSFGTQKLSINNSETVSVETSNGLLETQQAQVTTSFDQQEIEDLPTGGGLDRLALLVPGVVRTLGDNFSNSNGGGFSANGQRGRSNNFELDGQANNDNSIAGPQLFFRNEDAVQQIQIITNSFGAQYGRNAGSVVNYITKSGTNAFHGTGFFNWDGSWGSSLTQGQKGPQFGYCVPGQTVILGTTSPCIQVPKPRYVANEWGGTFGGPILKNKLFGFGSTLFRSIVNGASPSVSSTLTPTPTGLQQLNAAFPGNPYVQSLINQGPYSIAAGNPTPVGPSNVVVCALAVTTCPAGSPSVQFATVQRSLVNTSSDQEDLGRLDYQATDKDRFYLRYLYQNAPTFVSGGTISTGMFYNTFDTAHSVGADWTHTFGPHWLNQIRYGFQQTKLIFGGGAYPNCTTTSLASCPSNVSVTSYAAYGLASNIPQGRIVKATQAQDNANWAFGRHAFTFGGEFDYQNSPNTFLPNTNGSFSFTNNNYALAGNGTLTLANGNPLIPFTEPDVAAYFQDDWKVTPSLTLNLGLRWEFFSQSINLIHNETVARQTGSNPLWATNLPLSQTTFPYIPQNYKNFQPRLGFAYNPQTMPTLVIRGGYAINFDPAFYNLFLNAYSSAPVTNSGAIACNGTTVNCLPAGGTTNATVNAQDAQYNPIGIDPGTKIQTNVGIPFTNPYAQNYNLGVQYQAGRFAVLEVRYVGNHSLKNFQSLNSNPDVALAPPTSNVPATQGYRTLAQAFPGTFPAGSYCGTAGADGIGRLNCNLTIETTRANTAFSIYNALQTSVTMRDLHGLSGTATYTYSRTVDNASETYGSNGGGQTISVPQNPFNTNLAERGVSGQSYPNIAAFGLIYKVPLFSEQHGLVGRLLGGYSTNLIWTYNSGQPFTPVQPYKAAPNAAALAKIPVRNQGQALYSFCDYYYNVNVLSPYDSCRPILSNPNAPLGSVGINGGPGVGYLNYANGASISPNQVQWLYDNQYEAQGRNNPFPGVSRNTLRGNTVNNLDMSLFKTVRIREGISAQLRFNVYNLPNRAFYGAPDVYLNDANPAVHNSNPNNQQQYYASFLNNLANTGGAVSTPFGRGTRNIQIGGKIIF